MKKFVFDLITFPLSLFSNPIYDYIAMTTIGLIAFKIAFYIVGELGFRREIGSIVHWTIRFLVFVLIWFLCCIVIKIVTFIIANWIIILISVILMLILYVLKAYASNNKNSILNKKIF
jgi:hypothetical protein